MKNILSNKTLQATYDGDVIGGSVVRGQLGVFFLFSRDKWARERRTEQRSMKTDSRGSTGNQGLTASGVSNKKGASPPFSGNALAAKSYICHGCKNIIGMAKKYL